MSATKDAGGGAGKSQDAQVKSEAGDKSGKPGAGDLLMEATNLLRALRLPMNINVMKVSECGTGRQQVLLDSGATHALRPAQSTSEWNEASLVSVTLAEGTTTGLRLKPGTKILLSDPSARPEESSWIVPMGGLTEMNYKIEWADQGCLLYDERGQPIEVSLQGGCPVVSMEDGKDILRKLEHQQRNLLQRLTMVRALMSEVYPTDGGQMTMDVAMMIKMKHLFPELPAEVLERVVPTYDPDLMADPGRVLPWNRRKRRRLQRADNIVLHFYSGQCGHYWAKEINDRKTEVLCLDLLSTTPVNMLDPAVFWFVMGLAASGRVKVVMGGPPCRTVTALRYQEDGGPGVVRSEQHPYGCPGISPREAELVLQDTTLWMRMLLAYALCEDARIDKGVDQQRTALVLEQPEDPARYRSEEDVDKYHYMSMWRTREWQAFQQRFQVDLIHFDQGAMGHVLRKPTTLAIVMEELKQLHEVRGGPAGSANNQRAHLSMKEKCAQSMGTRAKGSHL